MAMQTPLRAAGFIIFRRTEAQIQYLLMQTSYGHHHWTPPKGHVDPGESDKEAALRETQEEAGLQSSHLRIIDDFRRELQYNVRGKHKTVIYWLAELIDPNTPIVMSEEHQDYRWLTLSEALALAKYQEMQEALQDSNKFLSQSEK